MASKKRRRAKQNRQRQQPGQATATRSEEPQRERPAGPRQGAQLQGVQRSRADKKDLARRQREELRKRVARKRRATRMLTVAALTGAIAIVLSFVGRPKEQTPTAQLPGILTSQPPWDANAAQADARATAIGLPAEGTTMHIHADVQVFVHGLQEPVPANIGISGAIQSLHTHDATGVVHMESSKARTFTLGEFFDVWGVRLTPSCLAGSCNGDAGTLKIFVNGQALTGDPRDTALNDQVVVVVTFGTDAELPSPIPSAFDFSSIVP